jgi:hypothetical protein
LRILKNNSVLDNVSVRGEFSPNFDLKNMILSAFKGIFMRKMMPNKPDFKEIRIRIARIL